MFWAYEAGGTFRYRHGGRVHKIPAAVGVHHEMLREILDSDVTFGEWAGVPADLPLPLVGALRDAYCVHQGLPVDPGQTSYLLAVLTGFGDEVEIDLRARNIDLREDFQARRWRRLVNAINHLPYATHLREKMLNDPEMARQIVESQAKAKGAAVSGIPVSEFTQSVAVLRDLITTTRGLQATLVAVNGGNKRPVEPYDGPITLLKAAETQRREDDHKALVARVLPGNGDSAGG